MEEEKRKSYNKLTKAELIEMLIQADNIIEPLKRGVVECVNSPSPFFDIFKQIKDNEQN